MPKIISIKIKASDIQNTELIHHVIAENLAISTQSIKDFQILKQSIDARTRPIYFHLKIQVTFVDEEVSDYFEFSPKLQNVTSAKEIYIAGAGPAGLFAALECIENGLKPIILERGKDVKSRRRDLAAMNKEGIVNPESNYCFGEGGAGTYSDGKLYTRSDKRGDVLKCLKWFHYFGADKKILYQAHPHIGTNKLPHIIEKMRETIIECGGEVRFETKLTDVKFANNRLTHIQLNNEIWISCMHLILATGHSARDIFQLLYRRKIHIDAKPLAIGVRIEHPQELINEIQYKCSPGDPILDILGAASYSLVSQEKGRGVFSFCMCPGGIIAPASTESDFLVVNGWSPSKRNGKFANSGMVVSVDETDFKKYGFQGPLAGMHYQKLIEKNAWNSGGGYLQAPAQRLTDFINKKTSTTLPDCSYLPGIQSVNLQEVLTKEIFISLQKGFTSFGKKLKGFHTEEAIVVATESRTSSPVKIPRNSSTGEHIQIQGLYPCGEGAGYAGGIISAAMDGIFISQKIKEHL